MIPNIWDFMIKTFGKMPQWVQVSTYFALLLLCIYLYLVPSFANGQLVAVTEAGGRVPYRGIDMSVHVGGRNLKFKTNEAGYWSIPVVSRLPEQIRVNIYHEDQHAWFPVVLDWTKLWRGDFEIKISDKEPYFEVELVENADNVGGNRNGYSDKGLVLMRAAYGAGLIVPSAVLQRAQNGSLEGEIREEIYKTVSKSMNRTSNQVNDSTPFSGSGGPSYVQRIQAIEELERTFSIQIPDEHWRSIDTVGGLIDYVYKRKLLEKENPALYQSEQNWPQIQQSAPPEQRVIFK